MDIKINNTSNSIVVADNVFGAAFNESLVHQVVVAYLAGARAGTKAQKTRSEVSGGGAKPWKQKGTGRARAGTIRSPLWRTGGVTFAAKPRSFVQKVNRKMYRSALRSIFAELYRQGRLLVFDAVVVEKAKTKAMLQFLADNQLGDDLLLIVDDVESSVYLGARNLTKVDVIDSQAINPVILLRHEKVVLDKAAAEKINEWLL